MIMSLKGKVDYLGAGFIILEVKDIGYKIFLNSQTLGKIRKGETKKFYLHQYIRESQLDLYGFLKLEELELFELLLQVSGIGPKAALAILSRTGPEQIKAAILNNDLDLFVAVSGVGGKTATRIILELKGKISPDDLSILAAGGDFGEVLEALKNLGYRAQEVRKVLAKTPKELKTQEEKIKWALQQLAKK